MRRNGVEMLSTSLDLCERNLSIPSQRTNDPELYCSTDSRIVGDLRGPALV